MIALVRIMFEVRRPLARSSLSPVVPSVTGSAFTQISMSFWVAVSEINHCVFAALCGIINRFHLVVEISLVSFSADLRDKISDVLSDYLDVCCGFPLDWITVVQFCKHTPTEMSTRTEPIPTYLCSQLVLQLCSCC